MLYHYYMKINFKLIFAAVLTASLLPCAQAQVTVVKQDGKKIYLDTSEFNRRVSVGDHFKIIVSQETLINPKTGKDLGQIYHFSPKEGIITEVQDLYAAGEMADETVYPVGAQAVIKAASSAAVSSPVSQTAEKAPAQAIATAPESDRKVVTYSAVEREIISAVKADLNAFPGEEFAALDAKGRLVLYTADGSTLRQTAEYKLPPGKKPLSLSALDLKGAGGAQLFAAVYDEKAQKIFTLVFDASDNQLVLTDTLPFFVKELGCGADKRLYAQKSFVSGVKPGNPRLLQYADGRFFTEKESFSSRGGWLTGLNRYAVQTKDAENLVYTASNGRLRLRLNNGKFTDSPALFATAPNRVKYKQDIISFYPSLQVYGPRGRATLAAVENTAKLGLLSQEFGQYSASKVHFLTYENGILDVRETLALNGVLYDTNCTARGILAPQVLSGGQTVLTEIYR